MCSYSTCSQRNCFCDSECAVYGDCCIDAIAFDPAEQSDHFGRFAFLLFLSDQVVEKVQLPHIAPVWLDLHEEQVRGWLEPSQYCRGLSGSFLSSFSTAAKRIPHSQGSDSKGDPLAQMPVTSRSSGITFSNYYCAVCNHAGRDVVFWKPRLECPTLQV